MKCFICFVAHAHRHTVHASNTHAHARHTTKDRAIIMKLSHQQRNTTKYTKVRGTFSRFCVETHTHKQARAHTACGSDKWDFAMQDGLRLIYSTCFMCDRGPGVVFAFALLDFSHLVALNFPTWFRDTCGLKVKRKLTHD